MSLKYKISLLISALFSVLFGIAAFVIFTLFASNRQEEFKTRLTEKAITTINLLIDVAEIDRQTLRVIDQNTINKLYNEKTLVFDSAFNLIYSSLDDTKIKWDLNDLKYLKQKHTFFKQEGIYEILGYYANTKGSDYYALVSASDEYGKNKLNYLVFLLILSFISFTVICWFMTSFAVKKLLAPIDSFHDQIKNINEHNLDAQLAVHDRKDEIDLLAIEFNQMLARIGLSYQKQKEFTAHASHELRTPISRLTSRIENKLMEPDLSVETRTFLNKLLLDVNQLAELISSLLLLSKLDDQSTKLTDKFRIDEIIYDTKEKLRKQYPDFKICFDIDPADDMDRLMEIHGSKSLLEIAMNNLLKNACIYSDNSQAIVFISKYQERLMLTVSNEGTPLNAEEQKNLFQPFMRGLNAKGKQGLGLGLRIVQRILSQHHATISYASPNPNLNVFKITF